MFVVLGATGNTGKVVAETLLAQKKPVRVVVRDAAKAAPLKDRGADVVTANVEDRAALTSALRGAEAAYFVIPPPPFQATNVLASRASITDGYAAAAAESGIKRAVLLSSIGGQHPAGTGIIQSLHHGEQALGKLSIPVTFIRAAYFLENWLGVLDPVHKDGVLPVFFPADKKIPQVATADIGATSAEALLEGGSGKKVIELSGPEEYSADDIAKVLGKLLGKPVNAFRVPDAGRVGALTAIGASQEMAELFVGLDDGIISGKVDFEGGSAQRVRGKVTAEQFFSSVLRT
jgi:uncharacterized protein YbjT (DUF2867 family)